MPWGDGTGPAGSGPRTGRGFGFCAGFNAPGSAYGGSWGRGRRFGMGRGAGWGRRFGTAPGGQYAAPPAVAQNMPASYGPSPAEELSYLKGEREAIKSEMESLEGRIKQLEAKVKEKKQ